MSASQPIGTPYNLHWRKRWGTGLPVAVVVFAAIASGCSYEYRLDPEQLNVVVEPKTVEIKTSALGERLWESDQDPLAKIAAAKILAKYPPDDGTPSKQDLIDLLLKIKAGELELESQALEQTEEQRFREDQYLELLSNVADRVLNDPLFDDESEAAAGTILWSTIGTAVDDVTLAEAVLKYGQEEKDDIAIIAGIKVLAATYPSKAVPTRSRFDEELAKYTDAGNEFESLKAEVEFALALSDSRGGDAKPDWPTFLGPERNGKAEIDFADENWPHGLQVKFRWKKKVGIGYGMCSISEDGKLYQFDRHGDRLRLSCFDAETGQPTVGFWPFEYRTDFVDLRGYNGGPRSSPVVDGNRVYIYGPVGKLHCVNAKIGGGETGRDSIWELDTARAYGVVQNQYGVGSTPLVVNNNLIVVVGGSDEQDQDLPPERSYDVRGNGSAIVALDKESGEEQYRIGNYLAGYASPQKAYFGGTDWCFAFVREGLLGFHADSGKNEIIYRWRSSDPRSVNASTPVVVTDQEDNLQVFVSTANHQGSALLNVTDRGFTPAAGYNAQGLVMQFNTPIYHNGFLYGSSGEGALTTELRCVDWQTGEWNDNSATSDEGSALGWSKSDLGRQSLLYVDGHFICLNEYGKLRLVEANPKEYVEVEAFAASIDAAMRSEAIAQSDAILPAGFSPPRLLKYPCWTAPVLVENLLYVRGPDYLVCFELTLGNANENKAVAEESQM